MKMDWGRLYIKAITMLKESNPDKDITEDIKAMSTWTSKQLRDCIRELEGK
jgi:hypothetical protein